MSNPSQTLSDRAFVIGSLAAVVTAGIVGFWLLGSPAQQRLKSLDQERVQDLQTIARQLQYGAEELSKEDKLTDPLPEEYSQFKDPVTEQPYEYRKLSDRTYELCATFDTQQDEIEQPFYNQAWLHPAGRHCYEMSVYSDIPKP